MQVHPIFSLIFDFFHCYVNTAVENFFTHSLDQNLVFIDIIIDTNIITHTYGLMHNEIGQFA